MVMILMKTLEIEHLIVEELKLRRRSEIASEALQRTNKSSF